MRVHSEDFKNSIKELGRQFDYKMEFVDKVLTGEELLSIKYSVNTDLLKTVMKQVNFECLENLEKGTSFNLQIGLSVNNNFEYINYGIYFIYEKEYQADTKSYQYICYDSMLFTMQPYKAPDRIYPTTLNDYLSSVLNQVGLVFVDSDYANKNRQITSDLYKDLGYTYRDVLDEICQAIGGNLIVNNLGLVEVKYPTETNLTFDEEYLNEINVDFGKIYGPVNSIVLSRSGGSDNIYKQDEKSVEEIGVKEIKISDNQIMNFNDRADYLDEILIKLNGTTYYLNDYTTIGICVLEPLDYYYIIIGDNRYKCLLLNDEQEFTSGLREKIYTEEPEISETDFTKADKTDRRINQTYLIVDKQNQKIEGLISEQTKDKTSITKLEAKLGEIETQITDIADITDFKEGTGKLNFEKVNTSEPISINIRPTKDEDFTSVYPYTGLYPSSTLYTKSRILRFSNGTKNVDYKIPTNLRYFNGIYDEFILDYNSQKCYVIKRVGITKDNTKYALAQEQRIEYEYPSIYLDAGDYEIYLLSFDKVYMNVRLMTQNLYTDQFVTKVEQSSTIKQTKDEIYAEVSNDYGTKQELARIDTKATQIQLQVNSKVDNSTFETTRTQTNKEISSVASSKVGNNEVISKILQSPESVKISANKLDVDAIATFTNNKLRNAGSTTINGSNITTGTIDATKVNVTNLNASNITSGTISADKIKGGTIDGNNINVKNLNANNITSGSFSADKLSGGTINSSDIDVYNSIGFIKAQRGVATHPYVSALNVANRGGGVSFRSSQNRNDTGYENGYLNMYDNAMYLGSKGTMNINTESGAMGIDSNGGYLRLTSMNAYTPNKYNGSIYIYAQENVNLNARNGYIYAGSQTEGNSKVKTDAGSSSSLSVKKNLVKFNNDKYSKALDLLNDIDLYNYDYKYNLAKDNHQYGFIIDEIEKLDKDNEFFKISSSKAIVKDNNTLDFNVEEIKENDEVIEVKQYDSDILDKYLLTICKALLQKVNNLEKEIEEMSKNAKN